MTNEDEPVQPATPDDTVAAVSFSRSGTGNPEYVDNDFWDLVTRQRQNAYWVRKTFGFEKIDWPSQRRIAATSAWREAADGPVFCFTRFGRSVTAFPDGRIIYIGGEHEDWYDPDFCIYNDIVVENPDGELDIHLYPKDVFPPTDFHTATLVGKKIYLIGSLGYTDMRRPGETPVYILDTIHLGIEPFPTEGRGPGWISRHTAEYERDQHAIRVRGGQIATTDRAFEPNMQEFMLDLATGHWRSSAVARSP